MTSASSRLGPALWACSWKMGAPSCACRMACRPPPRPATHSVCSTWLSPLSGMSNQISDMHRSRTALRQTRMDEDLQRPRFVRRRHCHRLAVQPFQSTSTAVTCSQIARRQDGNLKYADRQLHHALFNDDDAPSFRSFPPGEAYANGTADIVGLYFLADDFYRNLLQIDPGIIWGRFTMDAVQRATDFRHRHLREGDSLHEGDAWAQELLLRRLQQLLRTCYRQATLRSAEFLSLHAALERYLHPALAGSAAGPGLGHAGFLACLGIHVPA